MTLLDDELGREQRLRREADAIREGLTRAARRAAGQPADVQMFHDKHQGPLGLDLGMKQGYSPINRINRIYMLRDRETPELSEFLRYLSAHPEAENGIPPLADLSRELGISLAALREQLEVARGLGLVDVKPGRGTRRRAYSFRPAVRQSLTYALALNDSHFDKFAQLRHHLELGFWDEATCQLTRADKDQLVALVARARDKLNGPTPQVPHEEHRALHLLIFSRLDNPFVSGLLEAYWDMYEAVGLNLYSGDIRYLNEVWDFHARMVDCIIAGDLDGGRKALVDHVGLLMQRPPEGVKSAQAEGAP